MPNSGSIDIPHVTVHDHFIRKPSGAPTKTEVLKQFLRLEAINNNSPSERSRINAYLQQFERFEANPVYLDSAYTLLSHAKPIDALYHEWVLYFHLREDYNTLVNWVNNRSSGNLLKELKTTSYDNRDAWCAYRIGEAYLNLSSPDNAIVFLERSTELASFIIEFRVKLGNAYFASGQNEASAKAYKEALAENPNLEEALCNLGYVQIVLEDYKEAEKNLNKALELNPDYKKAKLNLATLYMSTDRLEDAMLLLLKLLEDYPGDMKIRAAIEYIENSYG